MYYYLHLAVAFRMSYIFGFLYLPQLLVAAWDSGNPKQEISTTVTINVTRNEYRPRFFPEKYTAAISEHDPVGTNITRVHATDEDLPVSVAFWSLFL